VKARDKFFAAVQRGDLEKVRSVVESNPSLVWTAEIGSNTPVLQALALGHTEMAAWLSQSLIGALRDGAVPPDRLYAVLHDLGEAQALEGEELVARFLDHEDPELRYITVTVLALLWRNSGHLRDLELMLERDPSEMVREVCARGIGFLMSGTKDISTTRLLLRRFQDEQESAYVQKAAYDALESLWIPVAPAREAAAAAEEATRVLRGRAVHREPEFQPRLKADHVLPNWPDEWRQRVDWKFVDRLRKRMGVKS
jgi:hypothetical protein